MVICDLCESKDPCTKVNLHNGESPDLCAACARRLDAALQKEVDAIKAEHAGPNRDAANARTASLKNPKDAAPAAPHATHGHGKAKG